MSKKLILHIGTEKTGTTSLQHFFMNNRDNLAKNNVFFPLSPGNIEYPNHLKLATACMVQGHLDEMHQSSGLSKQEIDIWNQNTLKEIKDELVAASEQTHLISSEHFSSRLISEEEIINLYNFLSPIYSQIEVILYLRRQDTYQISSYSTKIRSGGTNKTILPNKGLATLNYLSMYNKWSKVFNKITVRIYDRKEFVGENIIIDFMNSMDIKTDNTWRHNKDRNVALNSYALECLRIINQVNPKFIDGKINPAQQQLVKYMEQHHSGKPRLPQREFVQQWYKQFQESNLSLANILQREQLFDESFDNYPEQWAQETVTEMDAMSLLAELFRIKLKALNQKSG